MATVYVLAYVPADSRDLAEAAVEPYLTSPNAPGVYSFGVPLAPLPGPADADPVAYGVCAAMPDTSGLAQALPALTAMLPGSATKTVSPWRQFDYARDWLGWLAAAGLQPQRAADTPA